MVSLFWENTVLLTLDHHTAHVPHTQTKCQQNNFVKTKLTQLVNIFTLSLLQKMKIWKALRTFRRHIYKLLDTHACINSY